MSEGLLDHAQIERLAIETFARARGEARTLGALGDIGVDLEILPDHARTELSGVWFTVRLYVYEGGSIRDIKEQELVVVPPGSDDRKLAAYFEGIALGVRAQAETNSDLDANMPYDFFPSWALSDPERRTAADFASCVLASPPEGPSVGELDDLSGTEPIAVNRELEAAIAAEPAQVENYVVYADWLTERGDPRGELITCSLPDASPNAKRRALDVFAQHEKYFAGNLVSSEFIRLDWALGWIAHASFRADFDLTQDSPDFVAKALRGVLGLYASRLIQSLTLGCFDFEGDNDYAALYPVLVEGGPRPSMRTLFVGDTNSEEQELSWTSAADLNEIVGLYPNLQDLKVRAGSMTLEGALNYPKLESLVIESGGMSQESVRAVASASFPELRRLEIWTGSRSYGATSSVDDVASILQGKTLPKLEELGLRNSEYADDICRELAIAPILERVTSIDLSMGLMTDAGVDSLLQSRGRFARVKKLDVSDNYLSAAAIDALKGLGPHIEISARSQKEAEGDWRYVSVGE
jgi:uncharacterized protein (TIGR02996 family)